MATTSLPTLGELIDLLPQVTGLHSRHTKLFLALEKVAKASAQYSAFASDTQNEEDLGVFGPICFPFTRMGAISTLELFGLDELILFSFYWSNRSRYKRVVDIGGNLGLHTLLMARCGWTVTTYEPDPKHAELLRRNLALNKVEGVTLEEAAVSATNGTAEFVRVLGNTTSSHLSGSKSNPYGELERFPVRVDAIATLSAKNDFMKVDAEGQERDIVTAIPSEHWDHLDMVLEIGTKANAEAIFAYLTSHKVRAFTQATGWAEVTRLEHLPSHHSEGSVFLTRKPSMHWL